MLKSQMYRYLGRNGNITTAIKLEKIDPISMIELRAEQGRILTNGVKKVRSIIIFEDELSNWTEIDDDGQE
jgi:hypothetical protein